MSDPFITIVVSFFFKCLKLAKLAMFQIVDPTKEVCGMMA
jgi:hypothetical protein